MNIVKKQGGMNGLKLMICKLQANSQYRGNYDHKNK